MKNFFILTSLIFWGMTCIGQGIELCSSLNTSSDQRLQNAMGIGVQYQHGLSKRFTVGAGIHYNYKHANFSLVPYNDADPINLSVEKVNSSTQRLSLRLNVLGMLKNNDNVSLSIGPELSYNYFWGCDHVDFVVKEKSNSVVYSRNFHLSNRIGLGVISKVEIKNIITSNLSLCFAVRPEYIFGKENNLIGSAEEPLSGGLGFCEFQVGLKYSFGK